MIRTPQSPGTCLDEPYARVAGGPLLWGQQARLAVDTAPGEQWGQVGIEGEEQIGRSHHAIDTKAWSLLVPCASYQAQLRPARQERQELRQRGRADGASGRGDQLQIGRFCECHLHPTQEAPKQSLLHRAQPALALWTTLPGELVSRTMEIPGAGR